MAAKQLESIGHLCQSLNAPYARVRSAVDRLRIVPHVIVDGIPHYNERQRERISEAVSGARGNTKEQKR